MIPASLPIAEAFKQGTILATDSVSGGIARSGAWLTVETNGILTVAAVIFAVLLLKVIAELLPSLLNCIVMWRANVGLEHSISMSRRRDIVGASCMLTVSLLSDRFELFRPLFIDRMQAGWRVPALFGIFLAYQLLRMALHAPLRPPHMDNDSRRALCSVIPNFFILFVITLLPVIGAEYVAGASDVVIQVSARVLAIMFFVLAMVRKAQILHSSCSYLRTILYLCSLELIPVALLTVVATVL